MFPRLFLTVILVSLIAGCTTNRAKEEQIAEIEDLSVDAPAVREMEDETEDSGAQAYGTGGTSTSDFSRLDDPQTPPSERTIYFEYDSDNIRPEYHALIKAHAAYLAASGNIATILEGHADERGSREYNLALGERRARAVKERLTLLGGVSPNQIRMVSYGEERPVALGHDESAWRQNRRVEIIY